MNRSVIYHTNTKGQITMWDSKLSYLVTDGLNKTSHSIKYTEHNEKVMCFQWPYVKQLILENNILLLNPKATTPKSYSDIFDTKPMYFLEQGLIYEMIEQLDKQLAEYNGSDKDEYQKIKVVVTKLKADKHYKNIEVKDEGIKVLKGGLTYCSIKCTYDKISHRKHEVIGKGYGDTGFYNKDDIPYIQKSLFKGEIPIILHEGLLFRMKFQHCLDEKMVELHKRNMEIISNRKKVTELENIITEIKENPMDRELELGKSIIELDRIKRIVTEDLSITELTLCCVLGEETTHQSVMISKI